MVFDVHADANSLRYKMSVLTFQAETQEVSGSGIPARGVNPPRPENTACRTLTTDGAVESRRSDVFLDIVINIFACTYL